MTDSASAWSALLGASGLAFLTAMGGGIKWWFDRRRLSQQDLDEDRKEIIQDYRQKAKESEEELARVRAEHRAEVQAIRADLAMSKAETRTERLWSLYHYALADFWHAYARAQWHAANNMQQLVESLRYVLRTFFLKYPDDVRPEMAEKMERKLRERGDPPEFQTPTENIAKMRPQAPDLA